MVWLASCVPARIPSQLPIHCATPPSIYHGKVPTATRNSLYVQFPPPGKILTSCFAMNSWAASPAAFWIPSEGGDWEVTDNSSYGRPKSPLFRKGRAEIKDYCTEWPGLLCSRQVRCALLSKGWIQPLQLRERTSRSDRERSDCMECFGETADELWINFKMSLPNELVSYPKCVVNYQEASTFSPNDTILPN